MASSGTRKKLMQRELLDHAADLFAKKGYGGTSLREIADTAGVGRTTLYHYFSSKEDFLTALVEEVSLEAWTKLSAIRERTDLTPADRLNLAVRTLVLQVLESPQRFRVLVRDEDKLPADLARRHAKAKREALAILVGIIEEGISIGAFRLVDAPTTGLTIFGMCNWPAWWYSPDGNTDADGIADGICAMVQGALAHTDNRGQQRKTPADAIAALQDDLNILTHILEKADGTNGDSSD